MLDTGRRFAPDSRLWDRQLLELKFSTSHKQHHLRTQDNASSHCANHNACVRLLKHPHLALTYPTEMEDL